ncbi:MAG: M20/M25/M40 family metallo-hydrolase [Bacteroidota bacterium]
MKKNILFSFIFVIAFVAQAQQKSYNSTQITIPQLKKHINYLASDELEGRLTGTKGEQKAAKYISKQFKKYGVIAKGTQGYLQPFSVRKNLMNPHGSDSDAKAITITGHNVVGYIDNDAKTTVVIGAHYDHLGYDEYKHSTYRPSNEKEKPQIHNGADDNASGTAALIELAGLLKQSTLTKHNYLFLAFSGEEEGLLGSNYFTKHSTIDTASFVCMINMDMVGRLDTAKQSFAISGTGTSPYWENALKQIKSPHKIKTETGGTGASDHTSFYYINIPALHFFTGTHYDYHKPSDDEEKINYQGIADVMDCIMQLLAGVNEQGRLPFTPTAQDTGIKVSFKVTLGIMPDYLYDGKGVKVDGCTPGKPAANAGIQKGDIILKLGTFETANMQTYMKSLQQFKKGDETEAIIQRGNENITLKIKF